MKNILIASLVTLFTASGAFAAHVWHHGTHHHHVHHHAVHHGK